MAIDTQPSLNASYASSIFFEESWRPDSRAANHITPNLSSLTICLEYTGNGQLQVGGGAGFDIKFIICTQG